MSLKQAVCLLTLLVVFSSHATFKKIVKIPAPRSAFDISHDYHVTLINMALDKISGDQYDVRTITNDAVSQGRAEAELIKGDRIDLYWFGASKSLDAKLLPIPIPTSRGIIGFRKFIIRKENIDRFKAVKSIDDLRKFVACQGTHWPDTKVLNDSNLPVTTSVQYENLFMMLNLKRCDYFPRGYHDSINELVLRKRTYPQLQAFPNILLHYPFAIYFYTNVKNQKLAQDLEDGLKIMATNGEIEHFMKQHELTRSIYPLSNEVHDIDIRIPNNYITPNKRLSDPNYWIQLSDFKAEPDE